MNRAGRLAIAGLCNFLFCPLGYFWIGAWRTALVVLALAFVAGLVAFQLTLAFPPGIYALGTRPLLVLQLTAMVAFAGHAVWLARKAELKGRLALRIGTGLLAGLGFIALGLGIRAYWPVSVYTFSSASMQPSLYLGDVVAVRGARAICGHVRPRPGDVVVYVKPGSNTRYMHRVIAGPGQAVRVDERSIMIDGHPVTEQLVGHRAGEGPDGPGQASVAREKLSNDRSFTVQHLGPSPYPDTLELTLKPDQYLILGDNRENALDARAIGPVPATALCGVGLKVLRSSDPSRIGARP